MALSGSQKAYLWARSAIARSGATRSNYVFANVSIDWIVRDDAGGIIQTTNLSNLIRLGTLQIAQALNDEPDTCSFTLIPEALPAQIPTVGDEIRIAWASGPAAGVTLFYGFVLVSQADWRLGNMTRPWTSIQCQDPMWRFDARLVTYRFPAQSVSTSIAFLVAWFCNDPAGHPLNFSTAFVVPDMPAMAAFDVVNQRPSTVMRTLTAAVGGAFYLEGLTVHAWAGTLSEPLQTNPQPLTVGLSTLKSVRVTTDASQVRRRVLVEGRRTESLISWPSHTYTPLLGLPLQDGSLFPPTATNLTRVGTQWMYCHWPQTPTRDGTNPTQAKVAVAFVPGADRLTMAPVTVQPPIDGWLRVGNQYATYSDLVGNPLTQQWSAVFTPFPNAPYAIFTAPIAVGDTVEWVDCVRQIEAKGTAWTGTGTDLTVRGQPTSTPVVTLAVASAPASRWPALEGFVQDGRYSYAGAQARADEDLDTFKDPLVSVEWETEDVNALPGRSQVVNLTSPAFTPAVNVTVTILRVDLSFPLRTLPARRMCTGGLVKRSTFLDVVVTTSD